MHETNRHPQRSAPTDGAESLNAGGVLTPAHQTYVVNVSRPATPWRWRSILLVPIELLALAWSVPVFVLLIMVPIGLVLASGLWLGRLALRP